MRMNVRNAVMNLKKLFYVIIKYIIYLARKENYVARKENDVEKCSIKLNA